jgi:hypothetical protein
VKIIQTLVLAVCLSLLGTIAVAQDAPADNTVDLRPIWETGQVSRYRTTTQRVTQAQVVGVGKPRSSGLRVAADVTWEVLEAKPEGGGTCRMTVDNMIMAVTDAKGKVLKVTKNNAPENLKKAQTLLKAFIGKAMTVKVAADGRVTDVSGWDSVRNAAGEGGKNLEEADFIESATEMAVLVGGAQAASAGNTWNEKFTWSHEMGKLHVDTSYKVDGIEEVANIPIVTINTQSKLKVDVDKSKLNAERKVKIKLTKGEESSSIIYDTTRNEVVGRNTDRDMVFEMSLTVQNRTFKQVIRQRLNSQVLRIGEAAKK